jgi:endonuclease/exonuclease/phosphatase family metal-dependent hydrolase
MLVVVALGCSDSNGLESQWSFAALSWNVYVGADIERILTAGSPAELVAAVELTYQEVLSTDFPERAGRLANEIATTTPDFVGLQEISLLRTQSPGDAAVGGTTPAVDTLQDYLGLLLDSLNAAGVSYNVAAKVENWDVEMPRANGDDVRLTDFDVMLVKSGVTTSNPMMENYTSNLAIPIVTGATIEITRGWVAVDATVSGVTVRVVNTHLESAGSGIRLAQALELIDVLANETRPVILIGDLNSDAIAGTDAAYDRFTDAGYQDMWLAASSSLGTGLSCCQAALLDNASSAFDQRIDFVMVRNVASVVSVTGSVLGDDSADKTASGLWPSDHGGVLVEATISR